MEKRGLLYLALGVFSILILYGTTSAFVGFSEPTNASWYNVSWHYRIRLEINSTLYERTDWPIEYDINFTDQLPSGVFDVNSIRVFEYRQKELLYEVPSQFDRDTYFNNLTNAKGMLVFLMNGTSQANATRTFYVYYDTVENGPKQAPNYSTSITYAITNGEVHVNSTELRLFIDTNRGDNTSGLYRVQNQFGVVVVYASSTADRTAEYIEYYNGTNLTFNLIDNITIRSGPVRLTIEQTGDEVVLGNISNPTNQGNITKRYYIYNQAGPENYGSFIKIFHKFTNDANISIIRNSTPSGALAFDLERTLSSGSIDTFDTNETDPYSWIWGSGAGTEMVGIINLNETGTENYYARSSTTHNGRIGIELLNTTIPVSSSISQTSLIYFAGSGGSDAVSEFLSIKDAFVTPITISQTNPEQWFVTITPTMNITFFNRNETVIIIGNLSSGDPYNLTDRINATIDMGTSSSSDDQTIDLYDDGTHGDITANDKIFTNNFSINNSAQIGLWIINFSAYTNASEFLNSTSRTFNVTNIYNVSLNITNPIGLINRVVFANMTLQNYRLDTAITNASITCSFGATPVTNITEIGNGLYTINFTAPSILGTFDLFCNVTKVGNIGNNTELFVTEAAVTSINISLDTYSVNVTNITLYDNNTFILQVNATNYGNGTAYDTNLTMEIFNGWVVTSLQQCGNIINGSYCIRSFNITVPNATTPGNYIINATTIWRNPDDSNGTSHEPLNITVFSNPQIQIYEANITNTSADGTNTVFGTFTVLSVGNDNLQNISFTCMSGIVCQDFTNTFDPGNISLIYVGKNTSITINTTIPLNYTPGTYNGTINTSAGNISDSFIIFVIIEEKTNITTIPYPENVTVENITQSDNKSFSFVTNTTNIGTSSARNVNITITIINGWAINSSFELCGSITQGAICIKYFNVTVPNATTPGNYIINMTTSWTDNDNTTNTSSTYINIIVASNPTLNISPSNITSNTTVNTTTEIGNITIFSIGNDALQTITFNCTDGVVCQNFSPTFSPSSITTLTENQNTSVNISVTIPEDFTAGTYNGTVNITTGNDGSQLITLFVTVLPYRTWTLVPTTCQRSEFPTEGTACLITVINTGNDNINFTVFPSTGNHTSVNETNFAIAQDTNHTFSVLYNVTGYPQLVYNSTFYVATVQTGIPSNRSFNITLLPFIPPLLIMKIITNSTIENATEQTGVVGIYVNVTDQSQTGISYVNISIIRPNGTIDTSAMTVLNTSGNFSSWYIQYNNDTYGNTTLIGVYNITVTTEDLIGNANNLTGNFTVFTKLTISTTTLATSYVQGDTGSIYYSIRDYDNNGVSNVNVTFTITDTNGNLTYTNTQITDPDGTIVPFPTFTLTSDTPTGNYTLAVNSTYTDILSNITVNRETTRIFTVQAKTVTVTGLFADIETGVVWYPNNVINFGILIFNGEGLPVDPSTVNLTVLDPASNTYFTATLSDFTKQGTGFYTYQYAMPVSTATGMYLAVLNVTQGSLETTKLKAFRVASGGPYDVRLNLLENEVEQGTYLDFELIIENKGEVSQDVFVEYFTTSIDNSTTYYSASEAVLTPALTNQTFTRTAFVLSDQPLGNYMLTIRVTYDNVQPAIITNSTFVVIAKKFEPPTISTAGAGAPSQVTALLVKEVPPDRPAAILISKYNRNISLTAGMTWLETVTIKNTGQRTANDLSLVVVGIPESWYNITPTSYRSVPTGNSSVFLIEYNIPKDVKSGDYIATLLATSSSASDQKTIKIHIFDSLEELLRSQLATVKKDLEQLILKINDAENEGKYIGDVLLLVENIKNFISNAEKNLDDGNLENAKNDITGARNLIERAWDMLRKLTIIKVEAEEFPLWLIIIMVLLVGITGTATVLWKKHPEKIKPYMIHIGKIKEIIKMERSTVDLEKEKENVLRMLAVLEREKKEDLISDKAYTEMKRTMETKLNKIKKKIK